MEIYSPSQESRRLKTPAEELAFLRELLAKKEKEVAGLKAEDSPAIKESRLGEHAIKETLNEYSKAPVAEVLHKDFTMSEERATEIVLELTPEEHDEKMSELLGIMQTHGVKNALGIVEKLDDPHVQDDFERFLVQYIKAGLPIQGLSEKTPEFKALNMTLFEVVLPEKDPEERDRGIKELISSMEQFYSGMMSVDDPHGTGYFTIELAVANHSDEFTFFVAVHDSKKSVFQKQLLAIFHDAKILEKKDDYNVFNEKGATVGSYAHFTKNGIWPIKTYDQFDYDPLNSVLNSFSKIKTHGEGAAIQMIFRPHDGGHHNRFKKTLDDIMKGENISAAIAKNDEGVLKYVDGFFKGLSTMTESKEQKEKREAKKKEAAQNVDQIAVESFKQKLAAPIFAANLRVIASAEDETTALQILGDIESAFHQFDNPHGNDIKFERVAKNNLRSLLYDFSFRLFEEDKRLLANIKELTSLMHFPATVIRSSPHLKTAKSGSAPAPLELSKEGILLGENDDRGIKTSVYMAPEDRLRHFYVIGQTGTGKTNFLKNMIVQDIQNGEGVCMIDPHGSDIQDVLSQVPKSRYEDVIYFDPSYAARPMALNMLEYDVNFPEQKTFVVNELFSIFQKLYGKVPESMGPMFEQYFRNATMLVIDDPESGNTLLEVSRVMSNKAFREMKISKCKNPVIVQFWKEIAEKAGGEASLANIVPYITSKFDVFLANEVMRPIIAQEKSSFNFRDIMDNKKILLVNLSKGRLGDINANLIGLIIVGKILMAALSRVDAVGTGKVLPPFYLYIDEFQNITTNSISTILSEARKYKLSLTIAHQFIAQLEEGIRDSVFGNVGSISAFRVGSEDAEFLEKQFSPVFTAKDIMSIDNYNCYLKMLAHGAPVKPFNVKTMPPAPGNKAVIDALKELSYLKYGKDRARVEEDVMAKYKK